jgi:hypothetical protein
MKHKTLHDKNACPLRVTQNNKIDYELGKKVPRNIKTLKYYRIYS